MSSSKEEEYSEMPIISHASFEEIGNANKAEEIAAAKVNARYRLSERIKRWDTRTLENVGDDIKTKFSLTTGKLEKNAFALLDEYHALVAAHEKLFADCYRYTDEEGVIRYVYIYPTKEFWMGRPKNYNVLLEIHTVFTKAREDAKMAGDRTKSAELEKIRSSIFMRYGDFHPHWQYGGPDTFGKLVNGYWVLFALPSTAVLCPEPVVSEEQGGDTKEGCVIQGGGKKSKSKYSRKSKSKYLRKSKSKYLRKSKSKYSRKY
jgi:hypothetical protein